MAPLDCERRQFFTIAVLFNLSRVIISRLTGCARLEIQLSGCIIPIQTCRWKENRQDVSPAIW